MLSKLVENLVHLKRRKNRFDQHRRPNRPLRNADFILREDKDIVPQPCFEMALHFRQIEIGSGPSLDELLRIVEKVQQKIENPARHRFPIHQYMFLQQVPAARTNK